MTTHDLDLGGAQVWTIAFQPGSLRLWFTEGGTYLEVSGVWELTWPDGSSGDYATNLAGRDPATPRLIDSLAGSTIVSAQAELESSILDVEFDSGLRLHFEPTDGPYEEWEARTRDDRTYIALPSNELTWFEEDRTPFPPDPDWYRGTDKRLIDLEISERVTGVTVSHGSVDLLTRNGHLYFVGPFSLVSGSGVLLEYDPDARAAGAGSDAVLDCLLNNTMTLASLVPETSELAISFTDGSRLDWKPARIDRGQFGASNHDGRKFWNLVDGRIAWFGGPKGTYPKFLVGGPKESESIRLKRAD